MALTEPHYRWRAKDTTSPWRKKRGDPWRLLPHFMTESGAAEWSRAYGMEVQKVEGSGEVRQIHDYRGPPWSITSI
jgi:hypothetical protein